MSMWIIFRTGIASPLTARWYHAGAMAARLLAGRARVDLTAGGVTPIGAVGRYRRLQLIEPTIRRTHAFLDQAADVGQQVGILRVAGMVQREDVGAGTGDVDSVDAVHDQRTLGRYLARARRAPELARGEQCAIVVGGVE